MSDTEQQLTGGATMEIEEIKKAIPHRYPFLLVDRMDSIVKDVGAIGRKCVTVNEPFFQGHFPQQPVMPGVLIVEALAQTAGLCVMHSQDLIGEEKAVYFMTIDKARFRKPVVPGDVLELHVRALRSRGGVHKFSGEAKVDGKVVADAEFGAMIR